MYQREFIDNITPIIIKYAKVYNIKVVSPIIAQACLESAYGQSSLASKYYNFFGMKSGIYWTKNAVNLETQEFYNKIGYTKIYDSFRAYADFDSGIYGYFEFINTPRYVNLFECITPSDYITCLCNDGWATSPIYGETLHKIIQLYNLTQYDNFNNDNKYTIGNTYTLLENLYVRSNHGKDYSPVPYDELTEDAKKHIISKNNSILLKGTKVTCKDVYTIDNYTWLKIPSGWVCAIEDSNIYII